MQTGGGSSLKNNSNASNLTDSASNTLNLSKQKPFDLAQSLEVAEHLDESYANNFIALLTNLSDIVLFSAAIPFQGGTHHINERAPSFWADIFKNYDFICFDILRERFWNDERICPWYAQNILIFAHKNCDIFSNVSPTNPRYLVHYKLWEMKIKGFESHINYLEEKLRRKTRVSRFIKRNLKKIENAFKK